MNLSVIRTLDSRWHPMTWRAVSDRPSCLILSPTRELATQIYDEAKELLTYHNFGAQVVYGGTNFDKEQKLMKNQPCDIMVVGTDGQGSPRHRMRRVLSDTQAHYEREDRLSRKVARKVDAESGQARKVAGKWPGK